MGKRLGYFSASFGVGVLLSLALGAFIGRFNLIASLGLGTSCSNLFLIFCERKGKLQSAEEMNRPLTLFPRDLPR